MLARGEDEQAARAALVHDLGRGPLDDRAEQQPAAAHLADTRQRGEAGGERGALRANVHEQLVVDRLDDRARRGA